MTWEEFSSLLAGLLPETPLGYIVQIRSENDREKLKNFTPEQRRIRSAWRTRNMRNIELDPVEAAKAIEQLEKMIASAIGLGVGIVAGSEVGKVGLGIEFVRDMSKQITSMANGMGQRLAKAFGATLKGMDFSDALKGALKGASDIDKAMKSTTS